MDDIDRSLSIKLYDVMDKIGVSERIRKQRQAIAISSEIINTIENCITNVPCTVYIFGSHCEDTSTVQLNSDIDMVYCDEQIPVINNIQNAPRGWSYLLIGENHSYPGYVKLQWVHDGTLMTIFNTELTNDCDIDTEGRICQKHITMCKNWHVHERHGPADAAPIDKNIQVKARDNVYALRSKIIPYYAQTWLRRRRQYNWPSNDNLQKMAELGCFVVGVGHSSSREEHIEWRLSFSLQERLLMFSLNPTQHKCYVLLKIIKNNIVKAKIGECLSSYHCKTCILYALEATHAAIWRPDNLIGCVRICLVILLTWVVNGVCPNYFIPAENMFQKPQFRAKRYRLLEILRTIIADENSIILRLKSDAISYRILQPGINRNNMTDYIVYNNYYNFYKNINMFSKGIYNKAKSCLVTCPNRLNELIKYIDFFTNIRVIGEYSEQQTKDVISYVKPVLHLHLAQRLASLACKYQNQEHARQLLYLSFHHFQHGNRANLMTSRLMVVSLLLRFEKYDLCEIILHDLEHDLKIYVVTECSCYSVAAKGYRENKYLSQHLISNNVSCKTAIETMFVDCIRFARSDTEIAPLPLQYEMYRSIGTAQGSRDENKDEWFDFAAVDGKIYLYFLQYLVFSRLNRPTHKQVAIDNIVWVIGNDSDLMHTETAYNLLGWIHVQDGRIPEALRCFMASWRIRPDHNAGKFHVLNLIQDMMHH